MALLTWFRFKKPTSVPAVLTWQGLVLVRSAPKFLENARLQNVCRPTLLTLFFLVLQIFASLPLEGV